GVRTLTEIPTGSDAASRVFTVFRTTSENLASTISDVVNKGLVKPLSEVVSITASVSKGVGKFPLVSLVPSDVVGRVFTGARSISDNSVSVVSDSVTRAFTGFRSTAESLVSAIADSVSKAAAKFTLESLVPSDVVGRVFAGFRTLTEIPTVSDTASRVFTGFRTTSENLASTISAVVNKGLVKSLSEVVSVSDVAGRVFTGFRTLTEIPTVSDAASRVFTGFRTTSENLASTISDVVGKGVVRSLSEVVSITNSMSKVAGKFAQVSLVPSDVVGRVFTGARSISDNSVSVVSDSVTRAF